MTIFAKFWVSYAIVIGSSLLALAYNMMWLTVTLCAVVYYVYVYIKDDDYPDEHEDNTV